MVEESSNELTAKKSDLSEWYHQVLRVADIVDQRYDLKGFDVWKGYGFKAAMNLKKLWDTLFQDAGIEEYYFPLLVPIKYCEQNPEWWAGFKEEGFKAVAGENNEVIGAGPG